MASKDVSLVIKAKDQSSKELDKISASLKALTGNQTDLARGADKTGSALGGLAADVSKLQAATDRLKSLSNITAQLDKTSAAVTRMEAAVLSSTGNFAQLARDSDAAALAAGRLQAQLASEESALAANRAALRETSKELTQVNRLVKQAEAAQNAYNNSLARPARATTGVGVDIGAPQTSARASAGTFIAANLADAKATQAAVNTEVKNYRTAVDQATGAIKDLKPQIAAASALQRSMADDTAKAAAALSSERDDLGKARAELSTISDISEKAGTALGIVAVSQDQVSAAAAHMAANLAAAKAKIDTLSNVKATTSVAATTTGAGIDPTALDAQRRAMLEAKREWVDAQAVVKALAQQMKDTAEPTDALGAAFGRAQGEAKLAKDAYEGARQSLAKLGSNAQSSFAQFAESTSAVRSAGLATSNANTQIAASATAATNGQRGLSAILRQIAADMTGASGKTDGYSSSLRRVAALVLAALVRRQFHHGRRGDWIDAPGMSDRGNQCDALGSARLPGR
ncbi:MAG: hypothetical protein P4M09_21940, partial [Devosia sp.]|nr:hypothetical protein [Devosia sp.]